MKSLEIISVIICLVSVASILFAISINSIEPNTLSEYQTYEKYSTRFSEDPIILEISERCENSDNKIQCVFREIPMNYDYNRSDINSNFRSPQEYFLFGGVCRDYTVLRHSALKNLGIHCLFDFSQPFHVFLLCMDKGNVYEVNNEYLIQR